MTPHRLPSILTSPPSLAPLPEAADTTVVVEEACAAWLAKSPSADTRSNYTRDLKQFLIFLKLPPDRPAGLLGVRPAQVSAWRDARHTRTGRRVVPGRAGRVPPGRDFGRPDGHGGEGISHG